MKCKICQYRDTNATSGVCLECQLQIEYGIEYDQDFWEEKKEKLGQKQL